MKKSALSGRFAPAVAALVALAGTLGAAASADAGITVRADFLAGSIGFDSVSPPVYILSAQLDATGFTDDSDTGNFVRINTPTFQSTWYPAALHGSPGDGSTGYSGVADLNAAINAPGTTLTIFDAVTDAISTYSLTLSTPGFTDDHIRPVHFDGLPDGSVISDTPTLMFSQPAAMDPGNANTNLFVGLLASNPSNSAFFPFAMVGDTSWSPANPLAPDTYTSLVITQNYNIDQGLVSLGSPVLTDGPDVLESTPTSLYIQTSDQRQGLRVVPAPGAAALLGLSGLVATTRRRK